MRILRRRPEREPVLISREIQIQNELGLHARPAAQFARHASGFRSQITLIKEGNRYPASSLIEILRANLECGATATLEANGPDAEEAVESLVKLLHEFHHHDKS